MEPPTLQRKPTLPCKWKCAHFLLHSRTMLTTADHMWTWAVVLWDIVEDTIPAQTAISNFFEFIATPLFTTVLWCSVANTFHIPLSWRRSRAPEKTCGFVDSWWFTPLGPVGSIRHMPGAIPSLTWCPSTSHCRFNGPVQTIQKIICEVDLSSNVIRHAFQHPQFRIALGVVPPEKGDTRCNRVQQTTMMQWYAVICSDMQRYAVMHSDAELVWQVIASSEAKLQVCHSLTFCADMSTCKCVRSFRNVFRATMGDICLRPWDVDSTASDDLRA